MSVPASSVRSACQTANEVSPVVQNGRPAGALSPPAVKTTSSASEQTPETVRKEIRNVYLLTSAGQDFLSSQIIWVKVPETDKSPDLIHAFLSDAVHLS